MVVVVAALGFAVALVPLYNVLCEATGLDGKTSNAPLVSKVDRSRWVTVEFTGNVMPGLPWEFEANQVRLRVHPGEPALATYRVRNMADRELVGQAIASVTPAVAARNFRKIECFCFSRQTLAPGESRDMPVSFVVSPDLPPEVETLTLSYAFFKVDGPAKRKS
jgi:cytochrome c oxidase assembly protein subunit 11